MKTPSIFAVSSWWLIQNLKQMQTRHRDASFETHTMRSSTSGTSAAFGQFPALVTDRPIWRRAFFDIQGDDPKRPTSFKRLRSDGGESDRPAFMVNHPFSETKTCQMVIFLGQNPGFAIPALRSFTIRQVERKKHDMLGLAVLNFHGPEVCSNKRRSHWKPRHFSPMDSPRSAFAIEICAFCGAGAGQNLS